MKRLLIACLALLPFAAQARNLTPGTFELSGSSQLGFSSTSTEVDGALYDYDQDIWTVRGAGLVYVVPNLGIGLVLDHQNVETTYGPDKTETSTTTFGPMIGFNLSLAQQLSLKLNGNLVFAKGSQDDVDLDGFGWGVGAGLSFFPVPYLSVDAGLGYQAVYLEADGGGDVDTSGLNVGLGLSVYFGGR